MQAAAPAAVLSCRAMQAFLYTNLLVVTNGNVGHKDATCLHIHLNSPYAEHPLPWPTVASVQTHAGPVCVCIPGLYNVEDNDEDDDVEDDVEDVLGNREQPLGYWPHDVQLPENWWIDYDDDEYPYIFSADVDPQEIAAMHAANNNDNDSESESEV